MAGHHVSILHWSSTLPGYKRPQLFAQSCHLITTLVPASMHAQSHQYGIHYRQAPQHYHDAQAAYRQPSTHFEPQPQDHSWAQAPIPSGMAGYDAGPSADYYDTAAVPVISSTSQRRRASAGYYSHDLATSMNATPISATPPLSIARMSTPGIGGHHSQHHRDRYDYEYFSERPPSPGELPFTVRMLGQKLTRRSRSNFC